MEHFDLGVGLAFWLSLISTALCIYYGIWRWDKDGDELLDANAQQVWNSEEDAISEEL